MFLSENQGTDQYVEYAIFSVRSRRTVHTHVFRHGHTEE